MASKIDKKQLKGPDQFVTFWTRAAVVLDSNRRSVGMAVAAAVAIVGIAVGVGSYLERRDGGVSRAFARIEKVATAGLIPESKDVAKDGAKDAPKDLAKFDDDLPHFKTEAERQAAAAKEVESFLAAHGGSKLKSEALLLRARYQLTAGKPADAIATYQEAIGAGLDGRLRFVAQEGLGLAQEAAGDKDKAIATFGAMADEAARAGNFYRDRALFNKARILGAKGSAKDAEKIFHEILDKSPTTTLKDEINDRLAVLEGK